MDIIHNILAIFHDGYTVSYHCLLYLVNFGKNNVTLNIFEKVITNCIGLFLNFS